MISKKLLRTLKCETYQDFFLLIFETAVNGHYSDVESWIEKMAHPQRVQFLRYLLSLDNVRPMDRKTVVGRIMEILLDTLEHTDPNRNKAKEAA